MTGTIAACFEHKELDGLEAERVEVRARDGIMLPFVAQFPRNIVPVAGKPERRWLRVACSSCRWEVEPDAAELFFAESFARNEGLR